MLASQLPSTEPGTRTDVAYHALKQDILTGRRPAGAVFQSADVALELKMSRTPVNEALKMLALEGFLHAIPRVGYQVSTVTAADVHEIFQLRLILEPTAVELATARATPEAIAQLNAALEPAAGVSQAYAHRELHLIIARSTGNQRMTDMVERLVGESQRLLPFDPLPEADRAIRSKAAHVAIVSAIENRQPEEAREAMIRHLHATQARMLAFVMAAPKSWDLARSVDYGAADLPLEPTE